MKIPNGEKDSTKMWNKWITFSILQVKFHLHRFVMNWQKMNLELLQNRIQIILPSNPQCVLFIASMWLCSLHRPSETILHWMRIHLQYWMQNGLCNGLFFCYIKIKMAIESFQNPTYHAAYWARKIDFDWVFQKNRV